MFKINMELPSDLRHVGTVRITTRLFLEREDASERAIENTELILGELCSNAIQHTRLHPQSGFRVEVDVFDHDLCITVSDDGPGFNRAEVKPPKPDGENGWGIWLVEQVAEQVKFNSPESGGTSISASLPRQ